MHSHHQNIDWRTFTKLAFLTWRPEQARGYCEESLAAVRSSRHDTGKDGGDQSGIRKRDEEQTSMFLAATAVVPNLYQSQDLIAQACIANDCGTKFIF